MSDNDNRKRRISFRFSDKPAKVQKSVIPNPVPVPVPVPESSPDATLPVTDEIPRCFRKRVIMPRNPGNRRRFYGVDAFWDFDCTHLPKGYDVKTLRPMINAALQTFHKDLYLNSLVGFGNIDVFTDEDFNYLKDDFTLTKVVTRKRFCNKCSPDLPGKVRKTDEADSLLMQAMLFYGFDFQAPGNLLVITADQDFANAIRGLRDRGFTMFVAHPRLFNDKLDQAGSLQWFWDEMIKGQKNY